MYRVYYKCQPYQTSVLPTGPHTHAHTHTHTHTHTHKYTPGKQNSSFYKMLSEAVDMGGHASLDTSKGASSVEWGYYSAKCSVTPGQRYNDSYRRG